MTKKRHAKPRVVECGDVTYYTLRSLNYAPFVTYKVRTLSQMTTENWYWRRLS